MDDGSLRAHGKPNLHCACVAFASSPTTGVAGSSEINRWKTAFFSVFVSGPVSGVVFNRRVVAICSTGLYLRDPAWHPDLRVQLSEGDAQGKADVDLVQRHAIDRRVGRDGNVADHPQVRFIIKRDDDDRIGRESCKGWQCWRVDDDPRPHDSPTERRYPVELARRAMRAKRARPEAPGAALPAALVQKFAARGTLPEYRRIRIIDVREQEFCHRRSSTALVGTHSALVTRQHCAPATCDFEVPRIWRTPSIIRLKPWI